MTEPYEVEPLAAPPNVTVQVPGSRSFTNRALVAAALADGTSRIEGALTATTPRRWPTTWPACASRWWPTRRRRPSRWRAPPVGCPGQLRAGRPPVRHDEPLPAAPAGPRPRSLPARRARTAARRPMGSTIDALRELGVRGARGGRDRPPARHRGRTGWAPAVRSRCRAIRRASSCRACCWRPRLCPGGLRVT